MSVLLHTGFQETRVLPSASSLFVSIQKSLQLNPWKWNRFCHNNYPIMALLRFFQGSQSALYYDMTLLQRLYPRNVGINMVL